MILFRSHYQEENFQRDFEFALQNLFYLAEEAPAFLCIGTDKHLLDTFGPLLGTMLQDKIPSLTVIGTLEQPVHAKNLVSFMDRIQAVNQEQEIIAIDAAIGPREDIGMIQLRKGPLSPGKAMSRHLPAVGDYSLTAVLDVKIHSRMSAARKDNNLGLAAVYKMASLLSEATAACYGSCNQP
ncbi:MAG TPA: spore protease YyaC [Syntrophomonadaceae bacterium]|nr:spore protease YyaC [Syntrophomonadaceae bacterium]